MYGPILGMILAVTAIALGIPVLVRYFVLRKLIAAIEDRRVDKLLDLLEKPRYAAIAKRKLGSRVVEILFMEGYFNELRKACSLLQVGDPRCSLCIFGATVLGIDIETIIEGGETKVREVGIYAIANDGSATQVRLDFCDETAEWLNKLIAFTKPSVVVGHNVSRHDIPMLAKEGVSIDAPILDTLTLSLAALPGEASHALEHLAKVFGIEYTPHVPDEDARASVFLAKCLVGMLKKKGLLDLLERAEYGELSGLDKFVFVADKVSFAPRVPDTKKTKAGAVKGFDIVVVPDTSTIDSCSGAVWCPKRIVAEKVVEAATRLDGVKLLAAVAMLSAALDGLCDAEKLVERLRVREDIARAVEELCSKVCVEPAPMPPMIVEARYIDTLAEKMRSRVRRLLRACVTFNSL